MSSELAHGEVRPNDSEFFCRKQNLSTSNLHYWWVHSEFRDGSVNKARSVTSKRHVYGFLYHQKGKNTHSYFIIIITQTLLHKLKGGGGGMVAEW